MTDNDADADHGRYELRLYVAGQTEKSVRAIANLKRICRTHLEGRYSIEVIDLIKNRSLRPASRSSPCRLWCAACPSR